MGIFTKTEGRKERREGVRKKGKEKRRERGREDGRKRDVDIKIYLSI